MNTQEILQFIRLQRLGNAAFPAMSVLVGAVFAGVTDSSAIVLAVGIIIILNSVITFWNDIDDREVDAKNGRPLMKQLYGTKLYKKYVLAAILLSLLALTLSFALGYLAVIVTLVSFGVGWLYNAKPLRASHKPISSIVVLSFAGAALPLLLGASLSGSLLHALPLMIAWWCVRASVSILKDYKDASGDALSQKKTFLLVYGAKNVALVSSIVCALGIIGVIGALMLQEKVVYVEAAMLLIVGMLLVYGRRGLFNRRGTYDQFNAIFQKLAYTHILFDALVLVCLSI